jgi:hypothetical protein
MWDFVMDKSGAGVGFLRELWFPLPVYIPSASPQSSSLSPEAGTIGTIVPLTNRSKLFSLSDVRRGEGSRTRLLIPSGLLIYFYYHSFILSIIHQ